MVFIIDELNANIQRMVNSLSLIRISLIFLVVLSAKGANDDHRETGGGTSSSEAVSGQNPSLVTGEYGVLLTNDEESPTEDEMANNTVREYCIIHFNNDNLPPTRTDAKQYQLINYTTITYPSSAICVNGTSFNPRENSIILMKYDILSCNITEQAAFIEERYPNISGILLVFPKSNRVHEVKVNLNSTRNPGFLIALISERSATDLLKHLNEHQEPVSFFGPHGSTRSNGYPFDLSLVVIWVIAVFTVTVGSYWSGVVRADLYDKRKYQLSLAASESAEHGRRKSVIIEEEPYLNITPTYIVFFVCCMGGMLVALYFFFKYLVYLIIGLFVMASVLSVYACCEPLAAWLLPKKLTSVAVPVCSKRHPTPVYQIIILLAAIGTAFTWFFTRKHQKSWILQDILGVFFSINMLRTIRLPSYKICFILLSLLFFYDIFFVFLTPLITSSGDSVMVEVATGGSKSDDTTIDGQGTSTGPGESLPMVLRVPHLSITAANKSDPLDVCYNDVRAYSYSLLGFGDILVPGLLVSYCHAFDLIHGIKGRPYYVATDIFYGIGLIVTFLGLYFMNGIAQPALLYLVPCTLLPPIIIASCRGEFSQLWKGPGDGTESRESPERSIDKISESDNEQTDDRLLEDGETTAEPNTHLQTHT